MERLWVQLRQQSRDVASETRQAKQTTGEAKERMDREYLLLQNLVYEKQHLELELAQCRDLTYADNYRVFIMAHRTIYQNVPLVSVEEFMQTAPEALRPSELSENQLMINRLQFELDERKRYFSVIIIVIT